MRRFAVITMLFAAAGSLAYAQKKVKNKAEAQGIMALQQAQQTNDADNVIKAADDFITKFSDSEFKSYALFVEADAYERKNDHAKAIVYGEQAADADAANYDADILLANIYANTTGANDLDKEEKLKKAEKYANDGIAAAGKAPKPNPQLTDADWDHAKKSAEAQAYQALGGVALLRKKYDDAMTAYQKGVDLDPDPVIMLRAGRAMLAARKPAEAITWFDKAAASPDANQQIKDIAASDKKRAQSMLPK